MSNKQYILEVILNNMDETYALPSLSASIGAMLDANSHLQGKVKFVSFIPAADMAIENTKTLREFPVIKFKDRYRQDCSLQQSSLATESCVWLGVDRRTNLNTGEPLPDDDNFRMHLSVAQVANLLPYLKFFADNEYLPGEDDTLDSPMVTPELVKLRQLVGRIRSVMRIDEGFTHQNDLDDALGELDELFKEFDR